MQHNHRQGCVKRDLHSHLSQLLSCGHISTPEKDLFPAVICFHNIQGSYGWWGLLTASRLSGREHWSKLYTAAVLLKRKRPVWKPCKTLCNKIRQSVSDLSMMIIEYNMRYFHLCCSATVSFVWHSPLSIAYHVSSRQRGKGREYQVRRRPESLASVSSTPIISGTLGCPIRE